MVFPNLFHPFPVATNRVCEDHVPLKQYKKGLKKNIISGPLQGDV